MEYEPEGILENIGDKLGFDDRKIEADLERFNVLVRPPEPLSACHDLRRGTAGYCAWRLLSHTASQPTMSAASPAASRR
jgi:hypothetical protein